MAAGFFQEGDGSWSMTRLCAFLCCVAGCVVAVVWHEAATVTALVGGGAVALLVRTKE